MKLLIVDDEKDLLDQLQKTLTHQRYDVDTAADGDAALDKLFENPYDLVVLDIMLPKTDGLTVLREMRAAGHPNTGSDADGQGRRRRQGQGAGLRRR